MIAFISSVRSRTRAASASLSAGAVTTAKRQGCRLVLEGAVVAASRRRARTSRAIGTWRKLRTLRRARRKSSISGPSVMYSLQLESSVDVPDLAGHVARVVRGQEGDHASDLLG